MTNDYYCYKHVWNFNWKFILSTKIHMKISVIWRAFLFLTFNFHVNICFLNQIFSLCYLFFEYAFDIIFNFHRNERCKFHIRNDDQRVKKNKIVVNLWRFRFQHNSIRDDFIFNTKFFYQSQWRWFIVFCTTDFSFWILRN